MKTIFHKKSQGRNMIAIDNLSFSVKEGEIYGLLGPNGSGKTTLIKILATILLPDSGNVRIFNYTLPQEEMKVKDRIGVCLGEYERTFHWRLTGRQNLDFFCSLFGVNSEITKDRIDEALSLVGLQEKADSLFLEYSTGMKHKLALARAILNNPDLLLFDEPTAGLDLKTSQDIGNFIKKIAKDKKTIIYSTHRIEEAGNLCDRVLILRNGEKIAEEKPDKLKKISKEIEVIQVEIKKISEEIIQKIQKLDSVEYVFYTEPRKIRIHCKEINTCIYHLFEILKANDVSISHINSSGPTMEDVFLRITEDENE